MGADGAAAVFVKHHDLARLHIAHELAARGGDGAALAGNDVVFAQLTDAQRAEALRVPRGDELARAHHHQRIRPLQPVHRLLHGLFDAVGGKALAGDGVSDDLRIRRGVEDRARKLEFRTQLGGICQVAVVSQRHRSLDVADHKGLRIGADGHPRGGIAAVADAHIAPGHRLQHVLGEHVVHKAQLAPFVEHAVVVHRHAAALLAAVLQRVQAVIGGTHHVQVRVAAVNAEHAALFMQLFVKIVFDHPLTPPAGAS